MLWLSAAVGSRSHWLMSSTLAMCESPAGECSSRLVITVQPHSMAAFTVVLLARSPFSKNAAR